MMRFARLVLTLCFCVGSLGCTQQLSESDCGRFRDRLRAWGDKKGKLDQKSLEDFMKTCAGSTVSRNTAKCLEAAQDEASFFKCLE